MVLICWSAEEPCSWNEDQSLRWRQQEVNGGQNQNKWSSKIKSGVYGGKTTGTKRGLESGGLRGKHLWQNCELYLFCFPLNISMNPSLFVFFCSAGVFFTSFFAHNRTNLAGGCSISPTGAIRRLSDSANWKWHSVMHVSACRESRSQAAII